MSAPEPVKGAPLIRAIDLVKTYKMGDETVNALAAFRSTLRLETTSPSWGLRGPANRR